MKSAGRESIIRGCISFGRGQSLPPSSAADIPNARGLVGEAVSVIHAAKRRSLRSAELRDFLPSVCLEWPVSIGSHSGVGPGGGGLCPVRRASWAVVVEECCLLAAVSSGGVVCARVSV